MLRPNVVWHQVCDTALKVSSGRLMRTRYMSRHQVGNTAF
jgi:hypothetical protein